MHNAESAAPEDVDIREVSAWMDSHFGMTWREWSDEAVGAAGVVYSVLTSENALMAGALVTIGQALHHEIQHVEGVDPEAFRIAYRVALSDGSAS